MTIELVHTYAKKIREECTKKIAGNEIPSIRGMARLVKEAEMLIKEECLRLGLTPSETEIVVKSNIIDRTIGDVDVRGIKEQDFEDLIELLGIAIPGEKIDLGKQYELHHKKKQKIELMLLHEYNIDLRLYDIHGVGNSVLREELKQKMLKEYNLSIPIEQIFLCIGGMHGMDRVIRMLRKFFLEKGIECVFGFPTPGFAVAKWQAETAGIKVHLIETTENENYKITSSQLESLFQEQPQLKVLYLTITNNPTSYSYQPIELERILRVLSNYPDIVILADLAYIGTGEPDVDLARIQAFQDIGVIEQTIFVSSLSKTHTLTGDRFGWVSFGSRGLAEFMYPGWNNFSAGLPREWQLSFMAYLDLFNNNPDIVVRIRDLYSLRRKKFIDDLHVLNNTFRLFEEIGHDEGGGIYNWCKFVEGEDVFSLFLKTGIAGVPGTAFGYSGKYVRFSVGMVST